MFLPQCPLGEHLPVRSFRPTCFVDAVRRSFRGRHGAAALTGAALLMALPAPSATAATIAVDGTCTLANAIAAANTDAAVAGCAAGAGADTIILPDGSDIALPKILPDVTSTVAILGNGATIRRAAKTGFRLFNVTATGDLKINRATLTNGLTRYDGGGLQTRGPLTLVDCTVTGNRAFLGKGGGIAAQDGAPVTLTRTTVSANQTRYGGGGILLQGPSSLAVTDSVITGNTTALAYRDQPGGGILIDGPGSVAIVRSTMSDNYGGGGGMAQLGGSVTITDSTIEGNAGDPGGLFFAGSSQFSLSHSTVSGNFSGYYGAIFASSGTRGTITGSTISGNTAGLGSHSYYSEGGGLYVAGILAVSSSTITGNRSAYGGGIFVRESGSLTLDRTLVTGNVFTVDAPPDAAGKEFYSRGPTINAGFNLFGDGSETTADAIAGPGFTPGPTDIIATSDGTHPTPLAGILSPLALNAPGVTATHALPSGSPAIDAAGTGCPNIDQRGVQRPQDGDGNGTAQCDIGAFEASIDAFLKFSGIGASRGESGSPYPVVVQLSPPQAIDVTADLVVGGSAREGLDYRLDTHAIAIPAGQTSATVTLTPLDDALDEPTEVVTLTLTNPSHAAIATSFVFRLNLSDDDPPPSVSFAVASASVTEGKLVRAKVTLSAPSGKKVTVPLAVSGTATLGADFTLSPAGSVVFNPGQTSKLVNIQTIDDTVHDPGESVMLDLGPSSSATPGAITRFTLDIVDGD